jgi:hypothetical protein
MMTNSARDACWVDSANALKSILALSITRVLLDRLLNPLSGSIDDFVAACQRRDEENDVKSRKPLNRIKKAVQIVIGTHFIYSCIA